MLIQEEMLESTPNDRKEITSFVIIAQLGAVAAALVSAVLLRIAGFRLRIRRVPIR
jgi:hypothetical protein